MNRPFVTYLPGPLLRVYRWGQIVYTRLWLWRRRNKLVDPVILSPEDQARILARYAKKD